MHPLDAYLQAHDITATAFARLIDRDVSTITRVIKRQKRPGFGLMRQINDATSGAVTISQLVDAYELPAGQQVVTAPAEVNHTHRRKSRASTPEDPECQDSDGRDAA